MNSHDKTVAELVGTLTAFFRQCAEHKVLSCARWQPMEEFPNIVYGFDIAIVPSGSKLGADMVNVPPSESPITLIDVVTRDGDFEEEFYDKPDTLLQSSAYEYCLYDPTREVLRPPLQAVRKWDGGWRKLRSCSYGVFFSDVGFRLDVREGISISACGTVGVEEQLFEYRQRRGLASSRGERHSGELAGLDRQIRELEQQLTQSRMRREP